MITLGEARGRIGDGVVYHPDGGNAIGSAEDGVITGVGERFVYVRYAGDVGSKATDPAALTFLGQP